MQPSSRCPGLFGPFQDPGQRPGQEAWGDFKPMDGLRICVCLFVGASIRLPLSLCVCVSVCVYLCASVCLHVCIYVFPYVFVCVVLGVYVCVSVHALVCVCLCPCAHVGASLEVVLRGRGLLLHGYLPEAGL